MVTIGSDDESSQDSSVLTGIDDLERAGSDSQRNLFILNVVEEGDDTFTELPTEYPEKPDYLKDLTTETIYDDECACNNYDDDGTCDSTTCCIHYNYAGDVINGDSFEDDETYLTYMIQDSVYEFEITLDRHAHHQVLLYFYIIIALSVYIFCYKLT